MSSYYSLPNGYNNYLFWKTEVTGLSCPICLESDNHRNRFSMKLVYAFDNILWTWHFYLFYHLLVFFAFGLISDSDDGSHDLVKKCCYLIWLEFIYSIFYISYYFGFFLVVLFFWHLAWYVLHYRFVNLLCKDRYINYRRLSVPYARMCTLLDHIQCNYVGKTKITW